MRTSALGDWARDQRGGTLALTILWLPACLLAMALAVDGARLVLARERAHQAAALGALAGVQELDPVRLRAGTARLLPDRTRQVALRFALGNWRAAGTASAGSASVDVRVAGAAVEVTLRAPVRLSLAGKFFPGAGVRATARAGVVEKKGREAGKGRPARESNRERPRGAMPPAANTG